MALLYRSGHVRVEVHAAVGLFAGTSGVRRVVCALGRRWSAGFTVDSWGETRPAVVLCSEWVLDHWDPAGVARDTADAGEKVVSCKAILPPPISRIFPIYFLTRFRFGVVIQICVRIPLAPDLHIEYFLYGPTACARSGRGTFSGHFR